MRVLLVRWIFHTSAALMILLRVVSDTDAAASLAVEKLVLIVCVAITVGFLMCE